jgi:hypothetical protein
MAQQEERIVETDQTQLAPNGAVVREQTRATTAVASPKSTVANIVWYIYGLVAVLLVIRFIMKIAGASTASTFVRAIYDVTYVLALPFDSIFRTASTSSGTVTSVFEPSIIVAIVVYALIAWGIVKLIQINEPR